MPERYEQRLELAEATAQSSLRGVVGIYGFQAGGRTSLLQSPL